jgi:hypothetical protein
MLQLEARLALFDIPQFDGVVAGRASKDIGGCGIEEDMPDLPIHIVSTGPFEQDVGLTLSGRSAFQQVRHQGDLRHRCIARSSLELSIEIPGTS